MNIGHTKTKLTRVSSIKIPDTFFNRLSTGIAQLDTIYGGEGLLPGSVATIAAAPGSGKTTLLLQLCESLTNNGYTAAYITGEESVEMLAYTCKRLGLKNVFVSSETEIETIVSYMEDVDFIVFDSFPCLTSGGKRLSRTEQDAAIGSLVAACKLYETAMCIILHITKNGMYKGSTTIPHAVDINMNITIDEDDSSIRYISTTKNRYGSLAEIGLHFGYKGFDFDVAVTPREPVKSKAKRKEETLNKILALKEPPGINIKRVCKELGISDQQANYFLRQLVSMDKLVKYGRGAAAIWKHVYADKV